MQDYVRIKGKCASYLLTYKEFLRAYDRDKRGKQIEDGYIHDERRVVNGIKDLSGDSKARSNARDSRIK